MQINESYSTADQPKYEPPQSQWFFVQKNKGLQGPAVLSLMLFNPFGPGFWKLEIMNVVL